MFMMSIRFMFIGKDIFALNAGTSWNYVTQAE